MTNSTLFDSEKNNVFLFWHQGFEEAPEVVQKCLKSWQALADNESWEIHELSERNIDEYIDHMAESDRRALRWFQKRIVPNNEHYSWTKYTDLLRLCLLNNFGGIWTDSTVYCKSPLSSWIAFDESYPIMPHCASSPACLTEMWLIASPKGSQILKEWKELLIFAVCTMHLNPGQNWNFRKRNTDYWLKRISEVSPRFSLIWLNPWLIKLIKKSPYFIAYFCFNKTLHKNDLLNKSYLFTMAFDSHAWVEFNRTEWACKGNNRLKHRISKMNFIKLDWKRLQNMTHSDLKQGIIGDILEGRV